MNTLNIQLDIFKGEAFCRAACWYDLVTLASQQPSTIFWRGHKLSLQDGEFATTVRLLADRWNMSAERTRARLKEFAECGLIKISRTVGAMVITILEMCQDATISQHQPEPAEEPAEPEENDAEPVQVETPKAEEPTKPKVSTSPKPLPHIKALSVIKKHRLKGRTMHPQPRSALRNT